MQGRRPVVGPCTARLALAALVSFCQPMPLTAQEVQLRWKFEPGSEHVYEQVQRTHTTSPMGDMTQVQTTTLRHAVLARAADNAVDVSVTYEALHFVQDGPMGRQEFDSRVHTAPNDPQGALLARLVGTSFEMTIAPDGSVQRVSGADALVEGLLGALDPDSPMAAQAREMMEGVFGEDALKAMMQQGMQQLPPNSIAPGATWSSRLDLQLPFGRSRSEFHYTLNDIVALEGRRIARLGLRGTVEAPELATDNPMAGMMEMSGGEITGEIDFDVDRGLLVRSTAVTSMSASIMGQTMQIESTVEMKLVH